MTVAIYSRSVEYLSEDDLHRLLALGAKYGFRFLFNKNYAEQTETELAVYDTVDDIPAETRCIISYGGDGTFLHAVNFIGTRPLPVLGVNSGRLGFLSSVNNCDMETALQALIDNSVRTEERVMINARGTFSPEISELNALNEFTLQKNGLNMISIDAYVSGEYVATYMADGIIVSTPTGSTAYSLSIGGPIVTPGCHCFILNPIAPHHLTMRPLIIDSSASVKLKVTTRNNSCIATMDNRSFEVKNDAAFTLSVSPHRIRVMKPDNQSFYDTLRKKLMWGADNRK